MVVGGGYLLTALESASHSALGSASHGRPGKVAEFEAKRRARRASRSAGPVTAGQRRRIVGGEAPLIGGGVPSWAGSDRAAPLRAPVPQGDYTIDPDLGHARLGGPSAFPSTGSGGGGVWAGTGGPTGGAPQAGRAPSAPDLGSGSLGGASGGGTAGGQGAGWQSEARTLAGRTRALSRALGQLSRESRSAEAKSENRSAEAKTASGRRAESSAPGMPEDPSQVPLGGTGWLAAAGAAYALNRLRKEEGETDEGKEEG